MIKKCFSQTCLPAGRDAKNAKRIFMTENEIAKILVNIFLSAGSCGLESVYEAAICYELDKLRIKY